MSNPKPKKAVKQDPFYKRIAGGPRSLVNQRCQGKCQTKKAAFGIPHLPTMGTEVARMWQVWSQVMADARVHSVHNRSFEMPFSEQMAFLRHGAFSFVNKNAIKLKKMPHFCVLGIFSEAFM